MFDLKHSAISVKSLFRAAILACLVASNANGQTNAPEDRVIDARTQAELIDSISHTLQTTYVFPDVAGKIERHLREQQKKKAYAGVTSARELADRLTEDIRSINHDRHLWVEYLTDENLALLNADTSGNAAAEEELRQSRQRNFGFRELRILPGNVGYLKLNGFSDLNEAGPTAVAAMNYLANTDALIFDLRDNGGGSPKMIQLLSSYLFTEPVHLNSFYIRSTDCIQQFWTQPQVSGPRMTKQDVFVLTSHQTFSAAEEFTYNLKNLKRATIIGDTTGGGAHPNAFVHWRNLHMSMSVPFGKAINPVTGTNWEGTGVAPDITIPAPQALNAAHLEALKRILNRTTRENERFLVSWTLDGLQSQLSPIEVDAGKLQRYVGAYGPREIKSENGALFYHRGENPWVQMIPMSETLFRFEEFDYFRLEIVRDASGNPIELVGHYDNGTVDRSSRTAP